MARHLFPMLGSAPTWSDPTKRTTKLKNLDMVLVEKNHTDWSLLDKRFEKVEERKRERERDGEGVCV